MQKVILTVVFLLSLLICSVKANQVIDSLQQVLTQTDSVTHRADWFLKTLHLANVQVEHLKYDEALKNYQSILNAQPAVSTEMILNAKLGIGKIYYFQGNYKKALFFLKPIYLEHQKTDEFAYIYAEATRLSGMSNVFLGNYATSYELQIEALRIFNDLGDSLKIARLNYDIANTYFYQEQYQVALDYFQKALKIYKSHQDTKGLFRSYAAIGSAYGYLGQMDKAISFNEFALKSARKNGNAQDISWASLNVGANHYSKKNYKVALNHLVEGLKLSRANKDDRLASNILVTISRVYTDMEQFDLAIDYLEEGLALAQKSNDRSNIREIYKWFAETYYEKGNLEKYHYYIDQFIAIKDTLYNEEVMSQINSLQQDFEVQHTEREKEIALLKKNEEIQKLKENSLVGGAILGILVLSLISVLMYNRSKNQRALNQLLASKNKEILQQNKLLEASNKDLEQFAHIISHDLKEPLRNISGFTTLLKRRCHHYQDEEAAEYMGFVFNSVNQMHQLLTDLLDYSKISAKNKEQKQELVDTNQIVQDVLSTLHHRVQEEQAHIKVDNLPAVKAHPSQLHQVFQNLIINALKFKSNQLPHIHITCFQRETDYVFSVQDNGIGIEKAFFDKIFVPFQRLHNRSQYEGSGIGLSSCKKIIEEYGGKIWVESELEAGSTFYFSLPKVPQVSEISTSSNIAVNVL